MHLDPTGWREAHTFLHWPSDSVNFSAGGRVRRALPATTERAKSEVGRETDAKTQVCLGVHL